MPKKPTAPKLIDADKKFELTKKERKELQPTYDKILDSVIPASIRTSQPIKNGKPNG